MSPGPAAYEVRKEFPSPSWSFGSRGKEKREEGGETPGPGSYELPQAKVVVMKIAKSISPPRDKETPGPGSYNPRDSEKSPSYTCGLSKRDDPTRSSRGIPGPGKYNHDSSLSKVGGKISPEGRKRREAEESPGPGSYDARLGDNSLSFTMGGKTLEKFNENPGPGTYDPRVHKPDGFSIAKKLESKNNTESPGPAAYSIPNKPTSPAWTFHSRIFPKPKEEGPGPGQYYLTSMLSSKGFTFSKLDKAVNDPKSKIPGPGQYNTEKPRYDSPAFSLGKSSRIDFTKLRTNTPGPGAYDSASKPGLSSTSAKFSKAKRNPSFDAESSPGFYKVDLKPDGPFYSIQGKVPEKKNEKTPVKFI